MKNDFEVENELFVGPSQGSMEWPSLVFITSSGYVPYDSIRVSESVSLTIAGEDTKLVSVSDGVALSEAGGVLVLIDLPISDVISVAESPVVVVYTPEFLQINVSDSITLSEKIRSIRTPMRIYFSSEAYTPPFGNWGNESIEGVVLRDESSLADSDLAAIANSTRYVWFGPLEAYNLGRKDPCPWSLSARFKESVAALDATVTVTVFHYIRRGKLSGGSLVYMWVGGSGYNDSNSLELSTSLESRAFSNEITDFLAIYDFDEGDYLVIGIGINCANPDNWETTTLNLGNDASDDLDLSDSDADANNPWFEIDAPLFISTTRFVWRSESLTISEAVSVEIISPYGDAVVTDTVVVSESLWVGISVLSVTVAESLTTYDYPNVAVEIFEELYFSVFDSVSVADVNGNAEVFGGLYFSTFDSVSVTESVSVVAEGVPLEGCSVWVKVSGEWKQATVWVKDGEWKAATTKTKVSGVWV